MHKQITPFLFDTEQTSDLESVLKDITNDKFEMFNYIQRDMYENEVQRCGWVPLLDDAYLVGSGNLKVFRLAVEEKVIAKAALKHQTNLHIQKMLDRGMALSKKDRSEVKEMVLSELVRSAPSKLTHIDGFIDFSKKRVVIAATGNRASLVTAHLRKTIGSLPIIPLCPGFNNLANMLSDPDAFDIQVGDNVCARSLTTDDRKIKLTNFSDFDIITDNPESWSVTSMDINIADYSLTISNTHSLTNCRHAIADVSTKGEGEDLAAELETKAFLTSDLINEVVNTLY